MAEFLLRNCSTLDENVFNVTVKTNAIRNDTTAAVGDNLGLLIFLISIFLSFQFTGRFNLSVKKRLFERKALLRIFILAIIVLSIPVLIVLLVIAMCYKLTCSVIIKRKDKRFVSFLDSFDVFWNLEGGDSVINILGIVESDSVDVLLENMKFKLQKLLHDESTEKMFYRKHEEYGFYYWRKYNFIDMSEYIEIIELPEKYDGGIEGLGDIMTDLANKTLPYNDTGLFKIIITKQKIGNYDNERGDYGIIFRIHHSVGDGVALFQILCESLADKSDTVLDDTIDIANYHDHESPVDLMDMIQKLYDIPLCIVDLILRQLDENVLHASALMGLSSFKWTESDENLLLMIKQIKDNVDHFNFSDIVMTALSAGFDNYFTKTIAHVPDDVAVVIPVRLPPQPSVKQNQNILSNDFSIGILDLPIKGHRNLDRMKTRFTKFRNSNDFLANHYFLKLTKVLPKQVVGPVFNSNKATAAFSNLPGPKCLTICGGHVLKKLVFFVPLKGLTGIGVTALSYGGVLRIGVSADKALVSKPDHLNYILEGMVDEIKRLHLLYVKE